MSSKNNNESKLEHKWDEPKIKSIMMKNRNDHKPVVQPVSWLLKKYERGELNFDIPIQRREVWSPVHRGNLVISILYNDAIDNITLEQDKDDEDILHGLDGQNRTKTLVRFVANEIPFPKKGLYKMNLFGVDLNGLYFKDLPQVFQDKLLDFNMQIIEYKPLSDDARERIFYMKQQGMPLKTNDKLKTLIGVSGLDKMNDALNHSFIKNLPLTESEKKSQHDFNILIECMITQDYNGETGFDKKVLEEYATSILRDRGQSASNRSKLLKNMSTFEALINSIPDDTDYLKKHIIKSSHVHAVYNVLKVLNAEKHKVDLDNLVLTIDKFFKGINSVKSKDDDYAPTNEIEKLFLKYYNALQSGTKTTAKVYARNQAFEKFVLHDLGIRGLETYNQEEL